MIFRERIEHLIESGFQAIYIPTSERSRCEEELAAAAQEIGMDMVTWDAVSGFSEEGDCKDPLEALASMDEQESAKWKDRDILFVMRNLHIFLEDLAVRQAFQNLYFGRKLSNGNNKRPILILSTQLNINTDIAACVTVAEFSLPTETELAGVFDETVKNIEVDESRPGAIATYDEEMRSRTVQAMRGLTTVEAENILCYSLRVNRGFAPSLVDTVEDQKALTIEKSEILTYVPKDRIATMNQIGGYEELKDFMATRKLAYTRKARELKMDLPRGIVLLGIPGTGKCLGKGTPVLMYDGTIKLVEEIKEGDWLIGPDSKPREVLRTTRGTGQLYRVEQRNGDAYIVNDAHVLSLRLNEEYHNIPISDYLALSTTSKLRSHGKGWKTGITWSKRPVGMPPYMLGVWLGDGSSSHFAITTADIEIAYAVHSYAQSLGLQCRVEHKADNAASTYHVTRQHGGAGASPALDALKWYKVRNNKHIPVEYLINDVPTRLELLAGLMDTDGHCDRGCFYIVQKNKRLADDIVFLARSLGFRVSIKPTHKSCQTGATNLYWNVCISGNIARIPTRVKHKKECHSQPRKNPMYTGINITPVGEGEYYGFEIDGDHLFLLGDFTVTHNSVVGKVIARELGLPLVIINVSAVFGSLVGESERRIRTALETIDALDGAVALVDEAEKALGGASESVGDSGVSRRVFGCILTWLTEKTSRTFVVMTMNRTRGIPPEFLRKGRFDEIFYTDIPDEVERDQILRIHCEKRGVDVSEPSLVEAWPRLIDATSRFVGSEIEQIVVDARFNSFAGRQVGQPNAEDFLSAIKTVVPIVDSERENIEEIRKLCEGRARPVSKQRARTQPKKGPRVVNVS